MGHVTERMTEHDSHVRGEENAVAVGRLIQLVHPKPKAKAESGDAGGDADLQKKTAG